MNPEPKLSLFTPTNNPQYLKSVYASLLQQDYHNWEWVVTLNGTALALPQDKLPLFNDPRVRLISDEPGTDKIGGLKRHACGHCRGDAFIEMDHDDLLVPGALTSIAKAIGDDAGFVYSDSAVFENDLKTWGYHPDFGWEHYPVTVYGKTFLVTKTFDLSPRMLCEVYYAPDHFRAWSRKAYYKAGGHDPDMSVGDDHDLICRTYLTGEKFHYTGDCGYLYRWHESNTVKLRNEAIQQQQGQNRRKYTTPLIVEWCRRNGHQTLDLLVERRAGRWKPQNPGSYQFSSKDNYYGHIIASDVLQYVAPEDQVKAFNNFYRSLIPGGYLTVTVPSTGGMYADQNPMHRTRFNRNFFLHFSEQMFAQNLPGVNCKFDLIQTDEFFPPEPVHPERKIPMWQIYDMKMLRADLCALKGQKHPGPKRI